MFDHALKFRSALLKTRGFCRCDRDGEEGEKESVTDTEGDEAGKKVHQSR